MARRVQPGGAVHAPDIAAPMRAQAQRRADAQTASLPLAAFDLAPSHFGVMFCAHPLAAFANIRQSLRPGGRLVFVCFGRARHRCRHPPRRLHPAANGR
ncbi:MAG: methyltransferase domain-containing protein [Rhodobacteraceae bacterium]|nr:methyltransferase domain-containing protein [Paracoccaceae bacterium]